MQRQRFTVIRAPFGALYVTAVDNAIVRISPRPPCATSTMRRDCMPVLCDASAQIKRYFSGSCTTPSFRTRQPFSPFQKEVYRTIADIPYGKAKSSQQIASAIGKPYAVKAVESLCRANPLWIAVPTHRVILLDDTEHPDRPLTASQALRKMEARYAAQILTNNTNNSKL